jgi:hypothetical protein
MDPAAIRKLIFSLCFADRKLQHYNPGTANNATTRRDEFPVVSDPIFDNTYPMVPSSSNVRDPAEVMAHFKRIGRFRVLVIGRANSGKTTLLQRVCNTVDQPEVFDGKGNKVCDVISIGLEGCLSYWIITDWRWNREGIVGGDLKTMAYCHVLKCRQRGYHNIENELVFRSNPGFVFHDSCGFETGSVEELEAMKKFVTNRATTMRLEDRIHAIWWDNDNFCTRGEHVWLEAWV